MHAELFAAPAAAARPRTVDAAIVVRGANHLVMAGLVAAIPVILRCARLIEIAGTGPAMTHELCPCYSATRQRFDLVEFPAQWGATKTVPSRVLIGQPNMRCRRYATAQRHDENVTRRNMAGIGGWRQ
jgi:hypothetical protein